MGKTKNEIRNNGLILQERTKTIMKWKEFQEKKSNKIRKKLRHNWKVK